MKIQTRLILHSFVLLIIAFLQCAHSKPNEVYTNHYYKFYPVYYYINSGFDVTQNRDFFNQNNFLKNHKEIFRRLRNPIKSINADGGFDSFLKDEFLGQRAVPNYTLHMIGGGYDFMYSYEYFKSIGASNPLLYSWILSYAGHLTNEAFEISNSNISSHDNIADLFFFDVVGKLLFFNDSFRRFIINDLQFRSWHGMPIIDINEKKFFNSGLNYVIRPRYFSKKVRPFFYFGMQVLGGVSIELNHVKNISVGTGIAYTNPLNQEGHWATGIFYDENDRLLSSLIINGNENFKFKFSIYPFNIFDNINIGIFGGYTRSKKVAVGTSLNIPIGIGVGAF